MWRVVRLGVPPQLALDAEVYLSNRRLAGVAGPQSGQRLAHRAENILHGARLDLSTTGGQAAISVSDGKNLEDGDRILEIEEIWRQVEAVAVGAPDVPICILFDAAGRNNSGLDGCLDSTQVRAESISGRRWCKVQDLCCGYTRLKKARNCESSRSQ